MVVYILELQIRGGFENTSYKVHVHKLNYLLLTSIMSNNTTNVTYRYLQTEVCTCIQTLEKGRF